MLVAMPTLHIRNVPVDLYERLRAAAARNGRSLNAEVIVRLEESTRSWRDDPEWLARFEERGRRIAARIPPGFPAPEEMIRHDRDTR